jgi:amino acid transporter
VTYIIVSISYILLRKKEPDMVRPYRLKHWRFVGYGAIILCFVTVIICMPGSPSALNWPYEWGIIGAWILLGASLFFFSKHKRKQV